MRYLAILLLTITFFNGFSQSPGCPQITPTGANICQGQTANLTATAIVNNATNTYSVSSIPYTPFPYSGGTGVSVGTDDVWSNIITLPFNFCFFGVNNNRIKLGSNGQIMFNPASGGGTDNYPVTVAGALPSTANTPGNTINVFRDIDPSVSGANVSYYIGGSAPCRYLVFYFNNVALYSCTTPRSTFQMVLYENTNFIDIYIGNSSGSCSWQGGRGIVGIQNAAATLAYVAPGRNANNGNWTATNEAWRFSPTGASSSVITWYGPGNTVVGTGLGPIAVSPLSNTTYTSSMVITNCDGATTTYSNTALVTVNTSPTVAVASSNNITCNNSTAVLTATASGGTYNWSGPGITGGGSTSTASVNIGGTYSLTVSAAGCFTTTTINVAQDNIPPVINPSMNGILNCTLTSVNASATTTSTPVTYNWSGPSITSGAGTGTISVNQPGTYSYTVTNTNNGCITIGSQTVAQNLSTPIADAGPTQTLACQTPSVSLNGSGTSGMNYNWSGGVCGAVNSLTTAACNPGTYTLVATHPISACTASSSVLVVSSSTSIPQATVNAITNSITCTNTVVAIGVTPIGSDPYTYTWNGPNVTGSTTSATTTVGSAGNYSVIITDANTTCQSIIFTINVPEDITPVSASVAPAGTLTCLTNTLSLTATPTGTNSNYGYNWSGPGVIQNGTTANPTVNAGGNYVVTVTNLTNGCTGNYTVNVQADITPPTLNLAGNSFTTSCTTTTVQLGASSNMDPNTVYTWTVSSGGSLNDLTINNPIASSTGIYSVSVTNTVNGCSSAPQTVTVTSGASIPTYTLSASTVSLTCSTTIQTVTINTTSSDLTYDWIPLPSSGGNSSTPSFASVGSYTCIITNTVNNCYTNTVVTVVSNTIAPTVTIAPSASITCTTLTVNVDAVTTPSTGVSFSWSGSGIVGSSTGSSVNVNNAGTYDVIVTDAANGCTTTASSNVNSNTTVPSLNVSSTSTVLTCSISNSTLTATTSVTDTPTWQTPTGSSVNPVITNVAGTYIATVTDAINGCSSTRTITIVTNTVAPGASANNVTMPCGDPSILLNGSTTTTSSVSYSWSGPNVISGGNTSTPSVGPGIYTLTVTSAVNGCTSTTTVSVTQNTISVSFVANPTSGTSPLVVDFTNTSTGTTGYTWYFGNGNTSVLQNPTNTYTTGVYTATLVATAGSCSDTATVLIIVNEALSVEIPNVFTPNNDGTNEFFKLKTTGVKTVSMQIFNRWGIKLFDNSGGPDTAWDGEKAPDGTYFYFVKAIGYDDTIVEKNGTVNLFR